MNAIERLSGLLFIVGVMLAWWPASQAAAESVATIDSIGCDAANAKGAATYKYVATWQTGFATPVTYVLNVGNKCTYAGKACGVSNDLCQITCSGTCKAQMNNCQFGQAAWFQDSRPDRGYISRRIPAAGPKDKCLKK